MSFYVIRNNTTSRISIGNDVLVDDLPVYVAHHDLTQDALQLHKSGSITISPDPFAVYANAPIPGSPALPPTSGPGAPTTPPMSSGGGVRPAPPCGCPTVAGIYQNVRPAIIRS